MNNLARQLYGLVRQAISETRHILCTTTQPFRDPSTLVSIGGGIVAGLRELQLHLPRQDLSLKDPWLPNGLLSRVACCETNAAARSRDGTYCRNGQKDSGQATLLPETWIHVILLYHSARPNSAVPAQRLPG
ncbi:hypothetical protein G7046_g6198 [Stylonectria norvegica]|nr:hypothetical protein G7046_g6198 [Stylonectria norvegica]